MNIAIFASAFFPHFGGVEEVCRNLALEYTRRGHETIVLTARHPDSLPSCETVQGTEVRRFAWKMPNSSPSGMLRFARSYPADLAAAVRLLRQRKIDLIHVHCLSANGFYALGAARLTGLPLVVTTHGERTMDAGKLYQKSATANWTFKRLMAQAAYVTACSEQTLDDARQFVGSPLTGKSCPVYSGYSQEEFEAGPTSYPHPRPYLLGIGRVVPQKGFDVLIDAYARLSARRTDAPDLLIAGDGPERESLQKRASDLGLTDRVHLIGFADRPTAVSLFRGCEMFVLPSRHEPQGIVNLEAMACAKPVIASRVGGVPEIVLDGVTGLLVPSEDASALALALESLLADPDRARALGEAGQARATAEFTWPRIADQYFEIYDFVC